MKQWGKKAQWAYFPLVRKGDVNNGQFIFSKIKSEYFSEFKRKCKIFEGTNQGAQMTLFDEISTVSLLSCW